jgi:hypothetical protein
MKIVYYLCGIAVLAVVAVIGYQHRPARKTTELVVAVQSGVRLTGKEGQIQTNTLLKLGEKVALLGTHNRDLLVRTTNGVEGWVPSFSVCSAKELQRRLQDNEIPNFVSLVFGARSNDENGPERIVYISGALSGDRFLYGEAFYLRDSVDGLHIELDGGSVDARGGTLLIRKGNNKYSELPLSPTTPGTSNEVWQESMRDWERSGATVMITNATKTRLNQ